MSFCGQCGNKLQEGATFCDQCGTPVKDGPAGADTPSDAVADAGMDQAAEMAQDAISGEASVSSMSEDAISEAARMEDSAANAGYSQAGRPTADPFVVSVPENMQRGGQHESGYARQNTAQGRQDRDYGRHTDDGRYYPQHTEKMVNGFGIAGLAIGIISFFVGWFWLIPPIVGIVISAIGIRRAAKTKRYGVGFAVAGLICSIIALIVYIIFFLLIGIALVAAGGLVAYFLYH